MLVEQLRHRVRPARDHGGSDYRIRIFSERYVGILTVDVGSRSQYHAPLPVARNFQHMLTTKAVHLEGRDRITIAWNLKCGEVNDPIDGFKSIAQTNEIF